MPAVGAGTKARFVSSFNASVGSATLPQGSLYSVAAQGFSLVEAGWISGNTTAKRVTLRVLTTAGTPGAAQGKGTYDGASIASACLTFTTHTVAPTLGDVLRIMPSLAAAETGLIYGFHDSPISIPVGTANGVGFVPATASGAAQILFVWEE